MFMKTELRINVEEVQHYFLPYGNIASTRA
jgi:hypothetical protein